MPIATMWSKPSSVPTWCSCFHSCPGLYNPFFFAYQPKILNYILTVPFLKPLNSFPEYLEQSCILTFSIMKFNVICCLLNWYQDAPAPLWRHTQTPAILTFFLLLEHTKLITTLSFLPRTPWSPHPNMDNFYSFLRF